MLTPKQQRFVEQYLVDLNASAAARRAGYEWGQVAGRYVYFLIDPATGIIFYVGKGTGSRVKVHSRTARSGTVDNPAKFDRIKGILDRGDTVAERIFVAGLPDADALEAERHLILALRDYGLTNISSGCEPPGKALLRQAELRLATLLPFDQWIKKATDDQIQGAARLCGDPRTWHKKFSSDLARVVESFRMEANRC